MTLHEAISQILKESGDCGLTAKKIANLNEEKGLYRKDKGKGGFPEPYQVVLRVNKRGERNTGLFEPKKVTSIYTKIFLGPKNPLA